MKPKQKKILVRIIASSILLLLTILFAQEFKYNIVFYIGIYLLVGYDILIKAIKNIFNKNILDENFLMAVATIGAFCLREYTEAVAVVLLYQIGELFQSCAVSKSRDSIAALMNIRPDYANVIRNEELITVSPEEVAVGETILVKCGEKVPIDGTIIEGETLFDLSALTGESAPEEAGAGSPALSGAVNLKGTIKIVTKKEFSESTVSKILELTENVAKAKAPAERFITKFAKYYTPCVVAAAILLAVLPPLFVGFSAFPIWLERALIFLVVSCPCALVISVPLGFFSGIGAASSRGILIKGANAMQELCKVKTVLFDKTGTLTEGSFSPVAVIAENKELLLEYTAAGEYYSNHPIANAVKAAYSGEIDVQQLSDCKEIAGKGILCIYRGNQVAVGNSKLMDMLHITYTAPKEHGTVVYTAKDGQLLGAIVLSDKIKSSAQELISYLKKNGIKSVMLTGDKIQTAEAVAAQLDIDEYRAELLPTDKVETAKAYKNALTEKERLAFAGDGINDAPVLALSDVGIAMGGIGSDAALEAADIVIMNDDVMKIPSAIQLSKSTVSTVTVNIIFALAVKAAVLLLSALGFSNMWIAILADVGVCVLAVINSMRILYKK